MSGLCVSLKKKDTYFCPACNRPLCDMILEIRFSFPENHSHNDKDDNTGNSGSDKGDR